MKKKTYVTPIIKNVVTEDLMGVGLHNSVGNDTQLSKESLNDDYDNNLMGRSLWDE